MKKEQPKNLTILEQIEQKQFNKKLEDIRLETEKQEMLLLKARTLRTNSEGILYAFGSVLLFYLAVALLLVVKHYIRS